MSVAVQSSRAVLLVLALAGGATSLPAGASGAKSFSPITQLDPSFSSGACGGGDFGASIAYADPWLAVGAARETNAANAVCLFRRDGDTWTGFAVLTATPTQMGAGFGTSVALSGTTLLVGAPREDTTVTDGGAAYVFTFNGAVWSQQARLLPSGSASGSGSNEGDFGTAVAIDGDLAVVGRPYRPSTGSAHVFQRSGGSWTQVEQLLPTQSLSGARFGAAVAVSAGQVLVGAPILERAYLFDQDGATLATLQPQNNNDSDQFGAAVALRNGLALVGAPEGDRRLGKQGVVYAYGPGGQFEARITRLDGNFTGSDFGAAVALAPDAALIGAPNADFNFIPSVEIFNRVGGAWVRGEPLPSMAGNNQSEFGAAVALSDDGDVILAGAPNENRVHVLQELSTTLMLQLPPAAIVGVPYTVTAQVAATRGVPEGTIFVGDGTSGCNAELQAGVAACSFASSSVGAKTIMATYSGAPGFAYSEASAPLDVAAPTLQLLPATLPGATLQAAYSQTFLVQRNDGAMRNHAFTLVSGALPPGMQLAGSGVLSGPPTATGDFAFRVTATDDSTTASGGPFGGSRDYTLTVAKRPQTIDFPELSDRSFYPGAALPLVAGASSGLAVEFASQTPAVCNVVGASAPLQGAGDCILVATQPGNAEFAAATPVLQTIAIGRASQVIHFPSPLGGVNSPQPVGEKITLTAESRTGDNAQVTGLPIVFGVTTPVACRIIEETGVHKVELLTIDPCTVTANQPGNANYLPAGQKSHSINSAQGSQDITFNPPPAQYYAPQGSFTVTASASSGLPVSFLSASPSNCTVDAGANSATVSILAAGSCTIMAQQPGNASFTAASEERVIEIRKAIQSIVIDDPGAQYFAPGRAFEMSGTAFSPAVPGGQPVPSGLPVEFATQGEACFADGGRVITIRTRGICTVVAFQRGDSNYEAVIRSDALYQQPVEVATSTTVTGEAVASTSAAASDASGRYLIYQTAGPEPDVFRLDTFNGEKQRVDVDDSEAPIAGAAMEPSVSADGTLVVFTAPEAGAMKLRGESATERRKRLQQGGFAVLLRNIVTGTSQRLGGGLPSGTGTAPRISPDGSSVVWTGLSDPTQQSAGGQPNVFQRPIARSGPDATLPLPGACVTCKSVDAAGGTLPIDADGPSRNAVVSADGEWIAFETEATNLSGAADPCAASQSRIVLRHVGSGRSRRIDVPPGIGACSSAGSRNPSMDYSGARVAFESDLALEAADTNGQTDAFVSDASGNAVRISQGEAGAQSSQPSFAPQISGDGQTVAFVSAARELDPDVADGGTSQDLHVGTLRGGRVRNLSRLDAERSGQVASRNVRRPTLNYAGNKLMYDSSGGNLATAAPLEELRVFQQANPVNPDRIFGAGFD